MEGETPIKALLSAASLKAGAEAKEDGITLSPALDVKGLSVWMDKELMLDQADINMLLPLLTDTALSHISFAEGKLSLNEYSIGMNGLVNIQDTANMNATMQFETNRWDIPSLLTLVPESYRYLLEDLKVKGSSMVIKRGTKVKSIRLTENPEEGSRARPLWIRQKQPWH